MLDFVCTTEHWRTRQGLLFLLVGPSVVFQDAQALQFIIYRDLSFIIDQPWFLETLIRMLILFYNYNFQFKMQDVHTPFLEERVINDGWSPSFPSKELSWGGQMTHHRKRAALEFRGCGVSMRMPPVKYSRESCLLATRKYPSHASRARLRREGTDRFSASSIPPSVAQGNISGHVRKHFLPLHAKAFLP